MNASEFQIRKQMTEQAKQNVENLNDILGGIINV